MANLKKERIANKRKEVFNKYNGKCAYCGEDITLDKMHMDHIIPAQRGYKTHSESELEKIGLIRGGNGVDNLNPSCSSCNLSKSTFSIEVWREQIKLKIDRLRRDNTNVRILERFGLLKFKSQDVKFYFEK